MRRVALVTALITSTAACRAITADTGSDALLQVQSGTFFRAEMPAEQAGPKVVSSSVATRAFAGTLRQSAVGELERQGAAVAVEMEGDVGYWIVPAGLPGASSPDLPTFELQLGIRAHVRGPRTLVFRAVDGERRFGPPVTRAIDVRGLEAAGRLVVSLSWNNRADLDLHVVLPSGIEIFKRNPTEYERPPVSSGPVPVGAPTDGGVLDRDSNAQCVPDGRRAENVVWTEAPPKGHYTVRVDTYSLCTEPSAYWHTAVRLDGVVLAQAAGTSTTNDVRHSHNRGDGVLALEFDVP